MGHGRRGTTKLKSAGGGGWILKNGKIECMDMVVNLFFVVVVIQFWLWCCCLFCEFVFWWSCLNSGELNCGDGDVLCANGK